MCENLLVVVVSVCALATGALAQGDVNDLWDPAAHFEPFWESVEVSARVYNPAESSESDPNTQRQLTISAGARILDKTGLIGVNTSPGDVVAVDQDGTEIYDAEDGLSGSRWYRYVENIRRMVGPSEWADEFGFSLSVPMDPDRGYPESLSRVEWTMGALVADAFEVVDVPFEPNEAWIELMPGLEIMVAEASVEEGRYSYRIEAIYDPNVVEYRAGSTWHFWADEAPAAAMLLETEILNADGESVHELSQSGSFSGGGSSHSSEDGLRVATLRGSGSCSACGYAAIIRHTFALAPYEREARFVLEDIPVPGF
jgi:hypothetical protein